MTFHLKLGKIWISNAGGNCFAPGIQFKDGGIIIRTSDWLETRIYRRHDGSFDWNSDHIAYHLGELHEGDEERGYPDVWQYDGILGIHQHI